MIVEKIYWKNIYIDIEIELFFSKFKEIIY